MSFSTTDPRRDRAGTFQGPGAFVDRIAGLEALCADTAGDREICIAILDAPVDRSNPCLESAEIEQHWLGDAGHCSTHGTEIASVILGGQETAVPGIAPRCRAVSIPIFECEPDRGPSTHQARLASAIHEALSAGAHVINISAGESAPSGTAHPEMIDAARACAAAGVLIVSAAGNEGCDCLHVPAALPSVLAVGAMDWEGNPLPESNWGAVYATQGILAPGQNIPVAGPGGKTEWRTGTSYATAVVSGVAALLLSRELKRGRAVRPDLVRAALLAAAAESTPLSAGEGRRLLAGRLNLTRTIALLDDWAGMTGEPDVVFARPRATETDPPCGAFPAECQPAAPTNVPVAISATSERPPGSEVAGDRAAAAAPQAGGGGCEGGGERQLVYALGRLGHDFGSEAALDAFRQHMDHALPGKSPLDPWHLREFLDAKQATEPWHAAALLWTLNIGEVPIYVIRPEGPFDREGYDLLRRFFSEQFPHQNEKGEEVPGVECLALAGVITGKATLSNGRQVPVVKPDLRGLQNWNMHDLVQAAKQAVPGGADLTPEQTALVDELAGEFFNRIYYQLRNAGRLPQERVLNYAGSHLLGPMEILTKMLRENHALDVIQVMPGKLERPGSDCWDVTLSFFNRQHPLQSARWFHRFTVDVSEVIPVTIGETRSWKAR